MSAERPKMTSSGGRPSMRTASETLCVPTTTTLISSQKTGPSNSPGQYEAHGTPNRGVGGNAVAPAWMPLSYVKFCILKQVQIVGRLPLSSRTRNCLKGKALTILGTPVPGRRLYTIKDGRRPEFDAGIGNRGRRLHW